MADITPWLAPVISRVTGTTETAVRAEIAYVIKDFCRKAHPWKELTENYNVAAGEQDVSVNPIDNKSNCIFVLRAWWGELELSQATSRVPSNSTAGNPTHFVCEKAPDIVTLLPSPSAATTSFRALVSLAPRDATDWIPDFFETHHFEAILHGTLANFYTQPFKPYSSGEGAAYHLKQYRVGISEAKSMSVRGYTKYGQGWTFPAFGN